MKGRMSFISRRPSSKPGEGVPPSPKGGHPSLGGDETPMPEPMTIGGGAPRAETLGSTLVAMDTTKIASVGGGAEMTLSVEPLDGASASPTMSKGRSKSIASATKKFVDAGAAADEDADKSDAPVFPTSIREGYLRKKGVVNVAWKKRYMVLLQHQLAYYDDRPKTADALPKGFMKLSSVLRVEHHGEGSSKDFKFDVVTPTRIYQLQAESVGDMDAWIASISGTAANEQQVAASRRRNVSHAALAMSEASSRTADETYGIAHELSELRNWPNWNAFEVAAWLQTFGMARYSPAFYEAGVTGVQLKTLSQDFITKTCGVQDKADQTKLMASIRKLVSDSSSSTRR